ncbi:MAG TPA: tetratricopeptide repeat protein [Dongiaceae bacterium]|nr:tetratricopeptide repeat protein [Dongiaceae bacterium]
MMGRDAARRRSQAGLALVLVAAWLCGGLRRVAPDGSAAVLDSPLGIVAPRLVVPGWHLAPPGLLRISRYPLQSATLTLPAEAPGSAYVTREGSAVDAGITLRYHVDAERVLDVHRRLGPGFERDSGARWARESLGAAIAAARYADVSGVRVETLRDEVRSSLGDRLHESGLVLLACEVTDLRLHAAGPIPPAAARGGGPTAAPRPAGTILLVGLDGADWNIIDPLLERGAMPHLAQLIRNGTRGRMRTMSPMLSPVLWTSMATGVVPARHGILDFVAATGQPGEKVPVAATQRRVKAFWNMLTERGVGVGVVGWWATWPAETVDGFIVSDRVAYQIAGVRPIQERDRTGKVSPAALDELVLAGAVAPESITPADLAPFMSLPSDESALDPAAARLVEQFRTVLASGRTYVAAALALHARVKPTVTAVYLEGTDTVGHLFMPYAPPPLAGVDDQARRRFGHVVDAYYQHADELLGRLIEGIRPDTVLVVSDHGFRTGENRPLTESRIGYGAAADWHRKYGILVLEGAAFRKGVSIEEASVLDVTPTLLRLLGLPVGEDMDGRPIEAAFTPEWLAAHPDAYVPTWEGGAPVALAAQGAGTGTAPGASGAPAPEPDAAAEAASPDSEGDAERLQKLRDLGYIASGNTAETGNAHNNRGTTLLQAGKYEAAAEEFRKAIASGEDTGIARVNLGRTQYKMKDYDGAIATLEDHLRRKGASKDAENILGQIAFDRGRLDEAAEHYHRALATEPNFADARIGLGLLLDRQGRHDEALAEFRKVVAVDPDYAEGHNNIGVVLKAQGKIDEAATAFRRAIAADPTFAPAYSNLAQIEEGRGEMAEAERNFREALRREPGNVAVRTNFGVLLYMTGRFDAARTELERATAADPTYAAAWNNLGATCGRLGRTADEIAAYRKALALDPQAADLHHNLGLALAKSGETAEGESELRRALAIDAAYAPAWLNLARLLASDGRRDQALSTLRDASRKLPTDADLAILLGETAAAEGETDEAVKAFERALVLRPGDAGIEKRLNELRSAVGTGG